MIIRKKKMYTSSRPTLQNTKLHKSINLHTVRTHSRHRIHFHTQQIKNEKKIK